MYVRQKITWSKRWYQLFLSRVIVSLSESESSTLIGCGGWGLNSRWRAAGLAGGGAKGVTAAGVSPLAGGSPLAGVSKAPTAPGGALGGAAGGAGSWGS